MLDAAHFAVIARPGMTLDEACARTPRLRDRARPPDARGAADTSGTHIYLVEAETPNVSSTTIRNRLAAGKPIDDLVPAAVARHILTHHLYGAADSLHGKDQSNGGKNDGHPTRD